METFPELAFKCPMKWDEMRGNEHERFCPKCSRTIVNLSRLTEARRVALLATAKPGELCVAYHQRLSAPRAPATKRPGKSRVFWRWGTATAFVTVLAAIGGQATSNRSKVADPREALTEAYYSFRYKVDELIDDVRVYFGGTPRRAMIAGRICAPPTTPVKITTIPDTDNPFETTESPPPSTGAE